MPFIMPLKNLNFLLLTLLFLFHFFFQYLVWDQVYDGDKTRTVSALALMVTLVYVFALTMAIEPFDCVKREDGSYQLANNPSTPCFVINYMWLYMYVYLTSYYTSCTLMLLHPLFIVVLIVCARDDLLTGMRLYHKTHLERPVACCSSSSSLFSSTAFCTDR